jgi:hypothetical protein
MIAIADMDFVTLIMLFRYSIIIYSDAQRSSVWRSVAKASAERPDFAERERALERLTPSVKSWYIFFLILEIQ